jgi:hypothetical protein
MSGFLPLTHTTIRHMMENMDVHFEPEEIASLLLLDKAYLYPGEPGEE